MRTHYFARFMAVAAACTLSIHAKAEEPATLMTTRGKLLLSEDFEKPLAAFTGKPVGFASGFEGWKYNAGPATGKSGMWRLADGCFTGIESTEAHHPATASHGMKFQNAIIQCEVRLNDVPAEGRQYRSFFIKATDEKDYVCAVFGSTSGINALAYDGEHADPKTKQRAKLPAVPLSSPGKLNEWRTIVLEIYGNELVATLDGRSITLKSPLIAASKHSIMLGAGTEASFRHLRVWEALPNDQWEQNRAALPKKK
ncbi:MAG: hypothetical protein U1F81_01290 [Verrucomicrobiaceae bacterium]